MSRTPPAINAENDDSVLEIVSPDAAAPPRPFARKRSGLRSIANGLVEERNCPRLPSVHHPPVPSLDSDDPSHVPGPTPSDAPRARRRHNATQEVIRRRRNNPQNKLDDIQSVSSSSDVEKRTFPNIPEPQQRRAHKAGSPATFFESESEMRYQQHERPVDWGGRSTTPRKRLPEQALTSTPAKRKSSRRVPSSQKDEGIRQVKEDRQRREASQWNKSISESHPSPHRQREKAPSGPISIEDVECNEVDFANYVANMEEPNHMDNAQLGLGCDDDLKYIPRHQKDHAMGRRGSATTRPPRDVSEAEEVLSLDREEVAEEVKELNIDAPYSGPTHLIFEYPRGQKGKIRVTAEERGRLEAKKYLNDSLIDFFFKHQEVELQRRPPKRQVTAKFFSSFFFGRLRRTKPIDYEGVKGWTKDVDIFSKQFVFVPICDSYHWSLIIIANLHNLNEFLDKMGEDYEEYKRPRIVYLDSLDPSRGTSFGDSIRRYLVEEWLCRKKQLEADEAEKKSLLNRFKTAIPLLKAKVPLQTNEYDCGLYVLNSLEMFLKNERGLMDDLLCGEDQVSDAYVHVDIQALRETVVCLMNRFEFEWTKSTRWSPDNVPNNPTENGNALDLHTFKDHVSSEQIPENSIRSNEEGREFVEQYACADEKTSGSFSPDENSGIRARDDILSEERLRVNESAKVHNARDVGFAGESEVGKAIIPTGCASENPITETIIEDDTQDHAEGLRSGLIHREVAVGSASVSDVPGSSLKNSDPFERESYANSDFIGQQASSSAEGREHSGIIDSKTNEEVKTRPATRNHEDGNEKHQMESDVLISYNTDEGFMFQAGSHSLSGAKVGSHVILHESQHADDEVPETLGPGMNSLPSPQNCPEVGYGGNAHHLRHPFIEDEDLREIPDDTNEHAQDGIDIYKSYSARNHQPNDAQSRSHLCRDISHGEAIAQELRTVDHIGETKTYRRHA